MGGGSSGELPRSRGGSGSSQWDKVVTASRGARAGQEGEDEDGVQVLRATCVKA